MANLIHVLDESISNKIAAGEVIERPAAVVKELLENSIDAGATQITIEIEESGSKLIKVTDNGCGMSREDALLSLERHATSKIQDVDDLFKITTLGFRGEAMPSIASVSEMEIVTKTRDSDSGTSIRISGGTIEEVKEIGCPDGTMITVRDLFFNTPARLKYLRTKTTEMGHIIDLVNHITLAYPNLTVKLWHNGRQVLFSPGSGNLADVIFQVFGRQMAENMVKINAASENIVLTGYVGKPVNYKSNRNGMVFFVNGRFIKSRIIGRAVEEAFKGFMLIRKYPIAVLNFQIKPDTIDVNVHPTKTEVRFSEERELYLLTYQSVMGSLKRDDLIPKVEANAKNNQMKPSEKVSKAGIMQHNNTVQEGNVVSGKNPAEPRGTAIASNESSSVKAAINNINKPKQESFYLDNGEFLLREEKEKRGLIEKNNLFQNRNMIEDDINGQGNDLRTNGDRLGTDLNIREKIAAYPASSPYESGKGIYLDSSRQEDSKDTKEYPTSFVSENSQERVVDGPSAKFANDNGIGGRSSSLKIDGAADETISAENRENKLPPVRFIGQMLKTYLAFEGEGKIYLLDQHAAHERILYERFKRSKARKPDIQSLLLPIDLELTVKENEIWQRMRDGIAEYGFIIENFGSNSYLIRGIPVDIKEKDALPIIHEILELDIKTWSEAALHKSMAIMACRAAIKAGDTLTVAEMQELWHELGKTENPYNCPHGRPTIIEFSQKQLEEFFKRRV